MKVTPFGKFLRKLRIDHGVILKTMAETLGFSSAYLSSVELGKKNVSDELIDNIAKNYKLNEEEIAELRRLADVSKTQEKIDLTGASEEDRSLVSSFARSYQNMSDEKKQQFMKLLEG